MARRASERRQAARRLLLQARRDLRKTLDALTPEQWQAASLCDDWSVRDVAAHLAAWEDLLVYGTGREHAAALGRFVGLYARSLGSMARLNRVLAQRTRHLGTSELKDRFGDGESQRTYLFDGTNPESHLAEVVIHQHDIRGALGLEEQVEPELAVAALRGLMQLPSMRLPAWWRLRNQRLEATDADWARGRRDVLRLPAGEILFLLAGRA